MTIKTAQEFVEVANDPRPEVYHRFSCDEITDEAALEVIEKYPEEIGNLSGNETLSSRVIYRLYDHPEPRIRREMARKKNLTPDLFEKLSNDEDEAVRRILTFHPNVPTEILEKLCHDEWDECAESAQRHLAERLAQQK